MNVIIVSRRFNPGHFSHLVANYKLFKDCGFSPCLFVDKAFNKMDEKGEFEKTNAIAELNNLKSIDAAVFWFPSLMNLVDILVLRLIFRSRVVYVFHEPFDSIRNYLRSGFTLKKVLRICLINIVNLPVILFSHHIVLPSRASFLLYKKRYTFLNNNFSQIPLLFDDEAVVLHEKSKKCISYIGTIAPDHAFDRFVEFVDSALNNEWFPRFQYQIATSSTIPAKERAILRPHVLSGKVVISEGHPMSTAEINDYFRDSLVVWNAYHRSNQSGVLPKAYMFGAAVIVLSRNVNEFIEDRQTGILINDNSDVNEIKNAIEEIIANKDLYFKNCREKFFKYFYYKNNAERFLAFIK